MQRDVRQSFSRLVEAWQSDCGDTNQRDSKPLSKLYGSSTSLFSWRQAVAIDTQCAPSASKLANKKALHNLNILQCQSLSFMVNNRDRSKNYTICQSNLPQNTVSTLDIHEACLSPAKTRQHHAHLLQSKQVVHLNAITRSYIFNQLVEGDIKKGKEHPPPSPPGHPTILLS